ncbi:MAG: hypothetical protein ABMA13_18915 [Chthoniobacteraceae bacterium]
MRFDLRQIQRGIKALAPHVKKSRRDLAEEAARGFVKEIVAISPPASKGKRGSAAKKAGEGAIIVDLARVMIAAARRKGVTLGDPAEIHKRLRDQRTGRINPRNLKHPYPVDASALRALKRDLLKRVGELAAGWNAGAQKLGVKLPAWVARHGSGRSEVTVLNTFRVFRIILTNAVKYVSNVDAYDRRIQSAINIQGRKMQRKAEFLLARALRKAGWK